MRNNTGFTFVELLIYTAVFAILAIIFSAILLTFGRINLQQTARNEVSAQMNFVLQTIQREISNAITAVVRSDIDVGNNWDEEDSALGTAEPYLVLKTREESNNPNDPNSPVVIFSENQAIKIRRGRGSQQTTTVLTNDKVLANNLTFTKVKNSPGREIIEINLSLAFNSAHPRQQISRQLVVGIGKAKAAVFDTSLIPGNNAADIGQGSQRWRDGYFSNNLSVANSISANSLTVGGGSPVNFILRGRVFLNPPAIRAGENKKITIDASAFFQQAVDIQPGAQIWLTPSSDLEPELLFVGAGLDDVNDQVIITLKNIGNSTVNYGGHYWYYLFVQ